MIFETMVFPLVSGRNRHRDLSSRRASTLREARDNHADLVKEYTEKLSQHPVYGWAGVRRFDGVEGE